ncbi:MAG TPA: CpsD/CapB family tyrosine-protein kinase [Candidatus Krumholzibacteria bacterium]|nr:CpsD/CapB family tyrosine-protein kinase [Candidatus Krumholzibacteria bacterium]
MNASRHQTIFDQYDGESPIATELRRLYHNAKRGEDGRHYKSFLMTSSTRAEGKSTISSWLSVTIAQFPTKKVLHVDADLRRPRAHTIFGLENAVGLKDCLANHVDPMDVVKKTPIPNLSVITAGERTSQPGKLFESEHLKEVLNKLEFYYDIVIVDSAPVLAVSDTLFLCSEIEAVMLVVLAGVTPREVVQRTKDVLDDSRANLVGVVLNNATQVLPYYYDYKYYGYTAQDTK